MTFGVLEVSSWSVLGAEQAGLDEKEWLVEPATGVRWLFKPVITHGDWAQGEDWAEKVVSELGDVLGVPCAAIELARRSGMRGCVSRNLCPDRWEMQPGAVVLSGLVENYQPGMTKPRGRPGHSLVNIRQALSDLAPPPGADVPDWFTAFDVFAGYLLLDAWVANRDRHDENWSVLRPLAASSPPGALAGSYDHASSLGFNLRDSERTRRLDERSVEAWARRGTAWRFEHDPGTTPPSLVELLGDALRISSRVREHWHDRLSAAAGVEADILARVPDLSEPARTFALRLLEINRRRILDDC